MHELITTVLNLLNQLEDYQDNISDDVYINLTEALDDLLEELDVSDTDPNR